MSQSMLITVYVLFGIGVAVLLAFLLSGLKRPYLALVGLAFIILALTSILPVPFRLPAGLLAVAVFLWAFVVAIRTTRARLAREAKEREEAFAELQEALAEREQEETPPI